MMSSVGMIGALNAQTATGTDVLQSEGVTNSGTPAPVRVIDNKGTIKYLQSNNGITQIVNTVNEVTTTTWQLGGILTDSTIIDLDGNTFELENVLLADTSVLSAASGTTVAPIGDGTGSGFTILVRDEGTGEIKKLLASHLVESGHEIFTATASQTAYALSGSPELPNYSKVWVYRNGAKLLANVDYTVAASTVTLVPNAVLPNDWSVNLGDVIEIQFVK